MSGPVGSGIRSDRSALRERGWVQSCVQLAGGPENESVMRRAVDGLMIRITK